MRARIASSSISSTRTWRWSPGRFNEPLEVAGRADVHRVGERGDRRPRFVAPAGRPVLKRTVGVGGKDHRPDRQAHAREPSARRNHGRDCRSGMMKPGLSPVLGKQLQRGSGDIGHLRQQPAEVDRIGRGQAVRARRASGRRRRPSLAAGIRRNRRRPRAPDTGSPQQVKLPFLEGRDPALAGRG